MRCAAAVHRHRHFCKVTKENARSWLSWLGEMHGSNLKLRFIQSAIVNNLKEGFAEAIQGIKWGILTTDQLAKVTTLQDELRSFES